MKSLKDILKAKECPVKSDPDWKKKMGIFVVAFSGFVLLAGILKLRSELDI